MVIKAIDLKNYKLKDYKIKFVKRSDINIWTTVGILILSLLAGLLAVSVIFLFNSINPFYALGKIFFGSFGSLYGIQETITKMIPLLLIGAGLTFAFKAKFWNIGAEGQLLLGAILATWIGLHLGNSMPRIIVIPVMFIAGFIGGGLWGAIPAWLKVKYKINEVISTLMLNYIIAQFVQYLVYGPWKGKSQWGFPYTDNFSESATLPMIPGTRIHYWTLILGIIFSIILFIILKKSKFGYKLAVIGENPDAGKYGGIDSFKTIMIAMIVSGGLAGLAGVGEVSGIHHHLTYPWTISAGYGFTAIIVAWLAKLNPLVVILTSFFFGGILVGGDAIQTSLGLPFATINVFNGLILFFLIMGDFFLEYDIKIINKKNVEKGIANE